MSVIPEDQPSSKFPLAPKDFAEQLANNVPLVTEVTLMAHLRILAALDRLMVDVEQEKVVYGHNARLSPTPAAATFVARGLHRFELWIHHVVRTPARLARREEPLQPQEIPPLDVAGFLLAYMLSPCMFWEDCIQMYPELDAISAYPVIQVAACIDPATLKMVPSSAQIDHWERSTGVPFDPPLRTDSSEFTFVVCPKCDASVQVPWVASLDGAKTGYSDPSFHAFCQNCEAPVTKERLSVAKLIGDLITASKPDSRVLAGTLLNPLGELDYLKARAIYQEVIKIVGNPATLAERCEWKIENVGRLLKQFKGSRLRSHRIDGLLHPYRLFHPFSVDLPHCFLRLVAFAQLMNNAGWTSPTFPRLSWALNNATERYNLFLQLVLDPDLDRLSPTPDIDLVWHTHQLKGNEYRGQTKALLGIVLDHVDAGEVEFVSSFDATALKWRARFPGPYINPFRLRDNQCPECGGQPPRCETCASLLMFEYKPYGCVVSTSQSFVGSSILKEDDEL